MEGMTVREWQNTLIQAYVDAVKGKDKAVMRMTAHNVAVHIAHTSEAYELIKRALINEGLAEPRERSEDPLHDFTGQFRKVTEEEQEEAQIPWPEIECD